MKAESLGLPDYSVSSSCRALDGNGRKVRKNVEGVRENSDELSSQQNIAKWSTYSKGKCKGGAQEDFEDEWRKTVLVKR